MTRIFTEKELNKIYEMHGEPSFKTYQEISEYFKCDRRVISRVIAKTVLKSGNSGEKNPHHVLTEKDVIKMRELYKTSDMTYQDIANEFGVVKSTALRAIKGKNWAHIL